MIDYIASHTPPLNKCKGQRSMSHMRDWNLVLHYFTPFMLNSCAQV